MMLQLQSMPESHKDHNKIETALSIQKPSYFATHYCKTINVEKNEVALFPQYEYLIEFLDENKIPKNIHVEKSRQMMISWAFMVLFLYDLLFVDNVADFITSRKEFLVDDGGRVSTPHSLLGRIKFMWERLPPFMKQRLDFTYLKVTNPNTAEPRTNPAG